CSSIKEGLAQIGRHLGWAVSASLSKTRGYPRAECRRCPLSNRSKSSARAVVRVSLRRVVDPVPTRGGRRLAEFWLPVHLGHFHERPQHRPHQTQEQGYHQLRWSISI